MCLFYCIDPSLYCVVKYLVSSLYLSFLFLFFFVLLRILVILLFLLWIVELIFNGFERTSFAGWPSYYMYPSLVYRSVLLQWSMVELLYHIVYSVRYVSSFMVRRSVVLVRFVVCIPFGICTFLFRRSVVTSTLIASIGSDLYSPVLSLSLFCCFPLLLSLSLSGCALLVCSCVIDFDTYLRLFKVQYHVVLITRSKKSSKPRSPWGTLKQPFRDENTIFFENESKSPASNSNGNKNISFEPSSSVVCPKGIDTKKDTHTHTSKIIASISQWRFLYSPVLFYAFNTANTEDLHVRLGTCIDISFIILFGENVIQYYTL